MNFQQTDYFTYHPENPFDGIVTDIPYKGAITNKLGEQDFSIEKFMEKADHDTQPNAFLITFCNFLCASDIMQWLNKQTNKHGTIIVMRFGTRNPIALGLHGVIPSGVWNSLCF